MKFGATYKHALSAILTLLVAVSCSKQSADSSDSESDVPDVADKKMTSAIDKMAEEALQSPDKMEAADWVKRYPKSQIAEDEEGKPILLAPIVDRLREAGAQRIIIQTVKIGQGEFLEGMVVVLPSDAAARKKLFAMDPELSQLCQQTHVIDRGQKYLHYTFD